MKKNALITLLLLALNINAQQLVNTEPQQRNVLLEEYTGILCPNCPDGHRVANSLVATYPDRIWAVNIHAGIYADYSVNLKTTDGDAMYSALTVNKYPSAFVNRTTDVCLSRTEWGNHVTTQLEEDAECNVAGEAYIDLENRTATINVEVYYTEDSESSTNYLNLIMLQDEIIAYQQGQGSNSSQMVNGLYRHMHVFRDAVTPTWGEEITTTTKSSLFAKTYEYTIPETIGGVDVDINNVYFIAFVTEKHQGTPTRPVLNVNKLGSLIASNNDVYAYVSDLKTADIVCSNDKILKVSVVNGGLKDVTSMEFKYSVDGGEAKEYKWEGEAPSRKVSVVEIPLAMSKGEHNIAVELVKANDVTISSSKNITVMNKGLNEVFTMSETEELTLELVQDKYGYQITWELIASNDSVIATGGPYDYLSGSSATKSHEEKFTVPVGECVRFVIKDSEGNGICCAYGEGYYRILDSKGNVVVEGDGDFGEKSVDVISVIEGDFIAENNAISVDLYPNPTNGNLYLNAESITRVTVINTLGQVLCDKKVNADSEVLDMSQYEEGVYMVRIMTDEGLVTKRVTVVR